MARYELVVFDLDGVLVDTISSWDWVHRHFGVNNDASLTAYIGGEIDDREFMRRDIALWTSRRPGITIGDVRAILDTAPMIPGAVETVCTLKKNGLKCAIISGGLEILARRVSDACGRGFDHIFANGLACDTDGHLTGDGIPVVDLGAKDRTLNKLLKDTGTPPEKCVAIGDGIVDVCMFEIAGLGIAFNSRDSYTKDGADIVVEKKDLREILQHILK